MADCKSLALRASVSLARPRLLKLLALSAISFFLSQPSAHAANQLSCEALFQTSSVVANSRFSTAAEVARADSRSKLADIETTSLNLREPQKAQRTLLASIWNQIAAKKFSGSEFLAAKEFYRKNIDDPSKIKPHSREERLALFELLSEKNSLGIESLSAQIALLTPQEQKKFANQFSKRRFDKGLRTEEAASLFTQMYLLTHVEPRAWRQVLSRPISKTFESIIRQRAELELGRTDFVSALSNLGLIRESDMRGKIQSWAARNSALLEISRNIGLNAASFTMMGLVTRTPSPQALLAKPKFRPELLEILRAQQWEAAKPFFLREGRSYVHVDLALTIGMKVTGAVLMGVVIGYFAPMMLQATLPPGFTDQDEGFLALANDSVRYWFGIASNYITGDQTDRPTSSPADQQNQQDLDKALAELTAN